MDDEKQYLAERIIGLSSAIAVLIDHLAKADPALRREMADVFRRVGREQGAEHPGVRKSFEVLAMHLDAHDQAETGRPVLRVVEGDEPPRD